MIGILYAGQTNNDEINYDDGKRNDVGFVICNNIDVINNGW